MTMPAVDPAPYRALVRPAGLRAIDVIDQRALPHARVEARIADVDTAARAIREMWVRGAPLIGAVGAYGLAMALDADAADAALAGAFATLDATRPTAVNLRWALTRVRARVAALPASARGDAAWQEADAIAAEDVTINRAIGEHGLALLQAIAARKQRCRQRDDPLQCRRARDPRLRHRDGTAVPRACAGPAAARVRQRNTAAAAGRQSHDMGARAARHRRTRCSSIPPAACCCDGTTSTS